MYIIYVYMYVEEGIFDIRGEGVLNIHMNGLVPRGSIYTTIRELGPKVQYYRRNYGSQFPNGCTCGPSGVPALNPKP